MKIYKFDRKWRRIVFAGTVAVLALILLSLSPIRNAVARPLLHADHIELQRWGLFWMDVAGRPPVDDESITAVKAIVSRSETQSEVIKGVAYLSRVHLMRLESDVEHYLRSYHEHAKDPYVRQLLQIRLDMVSKLAEA